MPNLLVTGSSGLIGSEVVRYFDALGWKVFGVDNNLRADFFGPKGDTRWNQQQLELQCKNYKHIELDIRNREGVNQLFDSLRPDYIVHAAAQPSHDLAASRVFDDFEVNTMGTLNLLEACRRHCQESPFVFLSTNKVYGDAPNRLNLIESDSRWDYADQEYYSGIDENFPVDQSKHSLFGASKLAADIYVQEYGRYFGMNTCVLRGGCLTGPNHSGVELHGFLSYLIRVNLTGETYTIFGYKGKQVRDNIHALDVARFIELYFQHPRSAAVYNIGGGRDNACSILEAFDRIERISGKAMEYRYHDQAREGDHICYISSLAKIHSDYPEWNISRSLDDIFIEIADAWNKRLKASL
ncbi:MAG TPA: NAD-dependent epimerase/dehydratase family protein [Saprospiraceae bacterium]|nr:NAD-dependent epimerase/dehydratase family protein [Saprospiraceae bacterium]